MIITRLAGGLGNQMFQYAFGRAVALRNGAEFAVDVSGFEDQTNVAAPRVYALDPFAIDGRFATKEEVEAFCPVAPGRLARLIVKLGLARGRNCVIESGFAYQGDFRSVGREAHFTGYWQSEKYFLDAADVIRHELSLKPEFSVAGTEMAATIRACESVSLHVRRGDYVQNAATNAFHGTCSPGYYAAAVAHVAARVPNPHFFVFTDDPAWVKENLKIGYPATYVSGGTLKDYQELELMSLCRHNIIANSSFSWWGAWLNANPNKVVVAPKKWFVNESMDTRDLIPETWTRI